MPILYAILAFIAALLVIFLVLGLVKLINKIFEVIENIEEKKINETFIRLETQLSYGLIDQIKNIIKESNNELKTEFNKYLDKRIHNLTVPSGFQTEHEKQTNNLLKELKNKLTAMKIPENITVGTDNVRQNVRQDSEPSSGYNSDVENSSDEDSNLAKINEETSNSILNLLIKEIPQGAQETFEIFFRGTQLTLAILKKRELGDNVYKNLAPKSNQSDSTTLIGTIDRYTLRKYINRVIKVINDQNSLTRDNLEKLLEMKKLIYFISGIIPGTKDIEHCISKDSSQDDKKFLKDFTVCKNKILQEEYLFSLYEAKFEYDRILKIDGYLGEKKSNIKEIIKILDSRISDIRNNTILNGKQRDDEIFQQSIITQKNIDEKHNEFIKRASNEIDLIMEQSRESKDFNELYKGFSNEFKEMLEEIEKFPDPHHTQLQPPRIRTESLNLL
jgi:hypothetical protein